MPGHDFDLRAWLRRNPKPKKLRLTVDGDERIIALDSGKTQWAEVESTVRNFRPTLVECLTAAGEIIRSCRLEDDEASNPPDARERAETRGHQANAAMLDAYGRRLVEAFDAGARAAGVSQENLVGIVETLTAQLSVAITNQLTLAANYANEVARSGEHAPSEGEGQGGQALGLLMQMLAAKGLPAAAAPAAAPNGGKKTP